MAMTLFFLTLLLPNYTSYPRENLTCVPEIKNGWLKRIIFILWIWYTNYKHRNFFITRKSAVLQIKTSLTVILTQRNQKLFVPLNSKKKKSWKGLQITGITFNSSTHRRYNHFWNVTNNWLSLTARMKGCEFLMTLWFLFYFNLFRSSKVNCRVHRTLTVCITSSNDWTGRGEPPPMTSRYMIFSSPCSCSILYKCWLPSFNALKHDVWMMINFFLKLPFTEIQPL